MIKKLTDKAIEKARDALDERLQSMVEVPTPEEQIPPPPTNQDILQSPNRMSGLGGDNSATYSIFSGYNSLNAMPLAPANTDNIGYTFFTRPRMNLSYDNVIKSRILTALADQSPNSTANAMRWMLTVSGLGDEGGDNNKSLLFDDSNPFITLLSNTLISMPAFHDFTPDIYSSNEGFAKEQISFIDDKPFMYRMHSMTLNFMNLQGDPITTFFYIWTLYATCVAYGLMSPFPRYLVNSRIDYQTGIYRFTMDPTRRYVQNTAKTIAYPNVAPIGSIFAFDRASPMMGVSDQIGINFQCHGLEVNDPITIYEFNKEVIARNPMMAKNNREQFMVKLSEAEKPRFNYKAIPFILPDRELSWWIPRVKYDNLNQTMFRGI